MYKRILFLLCILPFQLLMAQSKLTDFPQGYTPEEVDAFRNGVGSGGASRMYPYLYPNVNWIDETFKDRGVSNKYTIEFRGGGAKFRYYTMANLLTDKGFIKTPNANDGYSTQNMYSRANLRTNLDIDLTGTTKLKLNLRLTYGI